MPASSTEKSKNAVITYLKGDATRPVGNGRKIIAHICNDVGGWGRGFVMAISRRWKEPQREFMEKRSLSLGSVQFVQVEDDIWVANMGGQRGIRSQGKSPPIRYEAVKTCLGKVAEKAKELDASVHMPRIGCGLAGGKWSKIEPIIEETLVKASIPVNVYDL